MTPEAKNKIEQEAERAFPSRENDSDISVVGRSQFMAGAEFGYHLIDSDLKHVKQVLGDGDMRLAVHLIEEMLRS